MEDLPGFASLAISIAIIAGIIISPFYNKYRDKKEPDLFKQFDK